MKNVSNNFGKTKAPSAPFKEAFRIWRDQLQNWAASGELLSAGAHALVLNEIPENLHNLNKKLMISDWSVIPHIEFLSSRRINGAVGAWSSSTRTIYLNEDWLATASRWSILQVLTEEFGHYLDSLVNEEDTYGDEGEKFQRILLEDASKNIDSDPDLLRNDSIIIKLSNGRLVNAEAADLKGGKSDDILNGTSEQDTINGLNGHDTIHGFEGHDLINGNKGRDSIDGGDGNDVINGGPNSDVINGGLGSDFLYGNSGNDYIYSAQGSGFVEAGDLVDGGEGDDVIIAGKEIGNDVYIGGLGVDTLDYSSAFQFGVTVDLNKGLAFGEEIGSDQLSGIENIIGSSKRDLLIGNSMANYFDGGGGEDDMIGKDGNDTYVVDTPQDRVVEEAGGGVDMIHSSVNQTLSANIENLTLIGRENLNGYGNSLNNQLIGNEGNNLLAGLAGQDYLTGNGGKDRFVYQSISDAGAKNGATKANRDTITDFNIDGIDLIDLSALDAFITKGNQDFVYIGNRRFSGSKGEVRFVPMANYGIISVNTNWDKRPEMQIKLMGLTEFSSDFLVL